MTTHDLCCTECGAVYPIDDLTEFDEQLLCEDCLERLTVICSDCGQSLSLRQRTKLLSALAIASEARGTDAAGIAYNSGGKLRIYKRPKAAHKLHFHLPQDSVVLMGHTRMTTQGDQRFNCNNHPFYGRAGKLEFALAHNGMLINDRELREKEKLPQTHVETDSYVAVQLLEQAGELSANSLAKVAEQLKGTFTLTLLDNDNHFYMVKGNNPFCLVYYPKRNLYLYAYTEEILKNALRSISFKLGEGMLIPTEMREILTIDRSGVQTKSVFSSYHLYSAFWEDWWEPTASVSNESYTDTLKSLASGFGFTANDVDELLMEGFAPEEIEEIFYGMEC